MRVVRRCVPGRAGGMSALANDWLGNWEYWEFWDYWELWEFFAPGCPGKSPCEQPFLCPLSPSTLSIPSTPRTRAEKRSRQSRRDEHTLRIGWGERTKTDRNGSERWIRRGARRKAPCCFPFSTVDSCSLPFFPAEPMGWAHTLMIGWGTGNTGSSGITGSAGSFLRRGIRGKSLVNSHFFARSLPVLLVFPVLPELGLKSVPGRAGGMSALANNWLGRYRVYGVNGGYGVCAGGARGMALRCFPFSTVDSCSLPFSRQSRKDGRARQGLAGELGILGLLGLLGALGVFCAGVPGEWHSVDFRFPPLIPVPFRSPRQSRNANDLPGNRESPMSDENSSAICKKKR